MYYVHVMYAIVSRSFYLFMRLAVVMVVVVVEQ